MPRRPAAAACYADYRAQKTNPLDLHYGVIQLPDDACSVGAAAPVIAGASPPMAGSFCR
jgi:hypothetical protein